MKRHRHYCINKLIILANYIFICPIVGDLIPLKYRIKFISWIFLESSYSMLCFLQDKKDYWNEEELKHCEQSFHNYYDQYKNAKTVDDYMELCINFNLDLQKIANNFESKK